MRILFLTTYFGPDITANGILMTQLAEELVDMGHQITVITSMPHYSTNRIWDEYRGHLWVREDRPSMVIYRVYLYVPQQKENLMGRLFSYVSFNTLSFIVGSLTGSHDLLCVPSPPLTNGLTGYLLGRRFRVPFVYNVQDIYPDIAIRLGVLKNPRIISFFQRMERFVYRNAEVVSVISEGFRRNLLAKGVPDTKIAVIPNFVDTDFITPLARDNGFSLEQGLDGCFVVLFAGNVGLSQGLDTVLMAAKRLTSYPDILFLIVGNGAAKSALQDQARQMGLTNVRFLPFQPHEVVPEMYASADLCLVPLRKGITQESVPSKVFAIMAAACPLVASVDQGSDTWDLVHAGNCGICVEPEDSDALATAILDLYHDRSKTTSLGVNGRQYVTKHFTKKLVAQQYSQLFQQVVGNI